MADDLAARDIVIFVTGYDGLDLPERYARRNAKPFGGISVEIAILAKR